MLGNMQRRGLATSAAHMSRIKDKLQMFVETGEILPRARPMKAEMSRSKFGDGLSPQKAVLLVKAKYDNAVLQTKSGKRINVNLITTRHFNTADALLRELFEALMGVRRQTKKPLDNRTLLCLLGVSPEKVKDSFKVTKEVLHLLEVDNDYERALHLCKTARGAGSVGCNAIVQWCLARGKADDARSVMVNRRKWGIPENEQSYVHYFDGLAECHQWGQMPKHWVETVVKTFESTEAAHTTSVFNAALSVLAKDFRDEQSALWAFFDQLELRKIRPDGQSFTILLNGVRKFRMVEADELRTNKTISAMERTRRLFENHTKLVQTANLVMEKLYALATPPTPPTKQQVEADKEVLTEYLRLTRSPPVEIDRVLATTFLQCFVNRTAGTSYTGKTGSHYIYLQQALRYVQAWCPEIRDMMHYVTRQEGKGVVEVQPSAEVQKRTDERVLGAKIPHDYLPETSVVPVSMDVANPRVTFPPAPHFNQKKAIFFEKPKRMVDFTRIPLEDLLKIKKHKIWKKTGGKQGEKLTGDVKTQPDAHSVNKFLLQVALDALANLGLHKEFYLGVWYAMAKWGGVSVDLDKLAASTKLSCSALPAENYPELTRKGWERDVSIPVKAPLLGPTPYEHIVDRMLVDNFIYRLDVNFPQSAVPARFATELFAALTAFQPENYQRRMSTVDAILSILNRNVHLYNDINRHRGVVESKKSDTPDNTPKNSLTTQQLRDILDPLLTLYKCIMVLPSSKKSASPVSNELVESYNTLINKLYDLTWTDAPEEHANALEIHKKIVHLGILLWRPKSLCDPAEKGEYADISISMEFVYNKLKDDQKLADKDKHLMLALKDVFQMDMRDSNAKEKFRSSQWKIYRNSKTD